MDTTRYRQADFTKEFCESLLAQYKSKKLAAQQMAPKCVGFKGGPVTWGRVKEWILEGLRGTESPQILAQRKTDQLNRIAELLEEGGVPIDEIGGIKKAKLSSWGAHAKVKNPETGKDEIVTKSLYSTQIELSPKWANGPEFPVVQRCNPTTIVYRDSPRILRKIRTAVWISDAQISFLRDLDTNELEPTHDPDAIDVAIQITADVSPDEWGSIGDWLDLASFSRWPQHPEYDRTAQPGIDEGHKILAQFIAAAGKKCKKHVVVGGNHDNRLEQSLLAHNKAAMGLRRANTTKGWPVFSMPYMLAFDELGVEYTGQYPGGEYWLQDDLVAMHAPPKKLEMAASVIHGHTHHVTQTTSVAHGRDGRHCYFLYDIGTVCKVGSTSNPQRLMRTLVPSDRPRTDWSQGIAIVEMIDGKTPIHQVSQVHITDGMAMHGGKVYRSRLLEKEKAS